MKNWWILSMLCTSGARGALITVIFRLWKKWEEVFFPLASSTFSISAVAAEWTSKNVALKSFKSTSRRHVGKYYLLKETKSTTHYGWYHNTDNQFPQFQLLRWPLFLVYTLLQPQTSQSSSTQVGTGSILILTHTPPDCGSYQWLRWPTFPVCTYSYSISITKAAKSSILHLVWFKALQCVIVQVAKLYSTSTASVSTRQFHNISVKRTLIFILLFVKNKNNWFYYLGMKILSWKVVLIMLLYKCFNIYLSMAIERFCFWS